MNKYLCQGEPPRWLLATFLLGVMIVYWLLPYNVFAANRIPPFFFDSAVDTGYIVVEEIDPFTGALTVIDSGNGRLNFDSYDSTFTIADNKLTRIRLMVKYYASDANFLPWIFEYDLSSRSIYDSILIIQQAIDNLPTPPTESEIYDYFVFGTRPDPFKSSGFSTHSEADVYTYFTSGSNEDQFKATGFSTYSEADIYSYFISGNNEYPFKAIGFSTHSVADIYNELQSGYSTPGTFGYYIDAQISTIGGGSLTEEGIANLTATKVWEKPSGDDFAYPAGSMGANSANWDATGAGGSGEKTVIIFPVDSASNDTLSGIKVEVTNLTGAPESKDYSNSKGETTHKLNADGWIAKAGTNSSRFGFDDMPFTVVGNDTFAILGYERQFQPPVDPDKARIIGFVCNMGQPLPGVEVKVSRVRYLNVVSEISNAIFVGTWTDSTDAAGFFDIEVPRSYIYKDTTKNKYNITGKYLEKTYFEVDSLYVPDTGNVNLTDYIN